MELICLPNGENLNDVIQKYQQMVYGLALTRTRNRADADDVFQEVFLAYYQHNTTFSDPEHQKAWLIRTTINCSNKLIFRKRHSHEQLSEDLIDPTSFAFETENQQVLYTALCSLPVKYRTVLHLFYFEDLSIRQISQALKLREGTVKMQLSRGRKELRVKLKGAF